VLGESVTVKIARKNSDEFNSDSGRSGAKLRNRSEPRRRPISKYPTRDNVDKLNRVAYRISEWSEMTGTSRITTWRAIRDGKLKAVDYCGIKLIPDSERARLFERGNERSATNTSGRPRSQDR
jgi:hypothetical protein